MKGKILNYDEITRESTISGDDGNRYTMAIEDWKGQKTPGAGVGVDFTIDDGSATGVFPDVAKNSQEEVSTKKIIAAILAFFLGSLGAHKFYLGYTTQGIIMLCVAMFGIILFAIPTLVIGVIAFIESVIYITRTDEQFTETYIDNKKVWF